MASKEYPAIRAIDKSEEYNYLINATNYCWNKACEYELIKAYQHRLQMNPELCKKLKEELDINDDYETEYDVYDTWYIVVNPKTKIDEREFYDYCEKAIHKKWIKGGVCWFEWTENEDRPCHANFVITKSKYPMSRVRSQFGSTFKNFVEQNNNVFINIQRLRNSQFIEKIRYRYSKEKNWSNDLMRSKEIFGEEEILNNISKKSYDDGKPIIIKDKFHT